MLGYIPADFFLVEKGSLSQSQSQTQKKMWKFELFIDMAKIAISLGNC